jgi:hypothetical protein
MKAFEIITADWNAPSSQRWQPRFRVQFLFPK